MPRLEEEVRAYLGQGVDGFKAMNDRHGHDFGDAVLIEIGPPDLPAS